MKNYTLKSVTVFLLLFSLSFYNKISAQQSENTFTIEGEIEGLGDEPLFFRIPGKNYENLGYWNDSIVVKDNKFQYTGTVTNFNFITFSTRIKTLQKTSKGGGYYPVKSSYLNVIIYPGAHIKVSGKISDFMEAYPGGEPINDELATLHKKIYPIMNESVNFTVKSSFEEQPELRKIYIQKSDSIGKIANEIKKEFVSTNYASVTAVYYLSDMMLRSQIKDEEADAVFQKYDKSLERIPFYKDVEARLKGYHATKVGNVAPQVKTKSTLDGSEFDLSSYRGKYVLIDFWGIWCGPCVGEMPKVKEYYEKYNGKLEILGVNSGDTASKIESFVTEKNYPWQQVLDVKNSDIDNFVMRFNVQGFPTKIILDPEGKIVARYVGSSEDAFKLLDELCKN